MKRTSSMVYTPNEESKELFLYAVNKADIYEYRIKPALASLAKHARKGEYDAESACDLWYYVACDASKSYNRDFGYSFSVRDRFTASVDMEAYFREDVLELSK